MPDQLAKKVSVADVRVAIPTSPGVEAGAVILREEDPPHRTFQIIIGQPEARAIMAAWTGSAPSRPSTWDLFVSSVGLLGGRVERAVVTGVEDGRHFFANLEIERDGQRLILPGRPSDAIALALRAHGATIYVAEQVLSEVGTPANPDN